MNSRGCGALCATARGLAHMPKADNERRRKPHGSLPSCEQLTMDTWKIYKDAQGEWRWTRTAPNGKIVGAATEGYKNRVDCLANARRNGYTGEQVR